MPSHMPTYYSWAKDRPCTTNEVYGYSLRNSSTNNEHRTHYSTTDAFPGGATRKYQQKSASQDSKRSPQWGEQQWNRQTAGTKVINKGYVAGYVPVTQKVSKDHRSGVNLVRTGSVPGAYEYPSSDTKNVYLWHTLSGTLVHCKNSNESS